VQPVLHPPPNQGAPHVQRDRRRRPNWPIGALRPYQARRSSKCRLGDQELGRLACRSRSAAAASPRPLRDIRRYGVGGSDRPTRRGAPISGLLVPVRVLQALARSGRRAGPCSGRACI
jgi:hypothetical protein